MSKEVPRLTIGKLSDKRDETFIKSGIKELDTLTGGFPRARITELWGKEGVGKTYLATKLMANLSQEHTVLFIDTEFSLNKHRVAELGVNIDNVNYVANSTLEDVTQLIIDSVGDFDIIILDSLAFLTPKTVAAAEMGERSIGLYALLIKQWVLKFRPLLGESDTAFIALNQFRPTLNLYAPEEPPGGKAWHHACDLRLKLSTNSANKILSKGVVTGHWVDVEVKKNKMGKPHLKTKFKLEY